MTEEILINVTPRETRVAVMSAGVVQGRLLVYLPHDPHIGISQKIEDETGRAQLRDRLKELLPPEEKGGFIVRTLAEDAAEPELAADLAYLCQLWTTIRERSLAATAPE